MRRIAVRRCSCLCWCLVSPDVTDVSSLATATRCQRSDLGVCVYILARGCRPYSPGYCIQSRRRKPAIQPALQRRAVVAPSGLLWHFVLVARHPSLVTNRPSPSPSPSPSHGRGCAANVKLDVDMRTAGACVRACVRSCTHVSVPMLDVCATSARIPLWGRDHARHAVSTTGALQFSKG